MKFDLNKLKLYFFKDSLHINLSVCRIIFYLFIIYYHSYLYYWTDFARYSELHKANGLLQFIDLSFLTPSMYKIFWYLSLFFACLSMIGLFSRISFFLSAILFCILNGLPQNYQTLVGLNCINTLILFLFSFTKAGDFYSIDQYIRKKFLKSDKPTISAEYTWPIHYFRFIHMLCYFFAALCKLRDSGLNWALSNNLKYEVMCAPIIRHDALWRDLVPMHWITLSFNWTGFYTLAAMTTLALELLSPLSLLATKYRWWLLGAILIMHFLSVFIVLIDPVMFMGVFVFWIDWQWLIQKVRTADS